MSKRIISIVTVILMLALTLPVSAGEPGLRHPTPEGYSDHDYQAMADFFDQEITVTYFGQTITMAYYEAIHMLVPSFDINDPSTWNITYNGAQQFSTLWEEHCGELCLIRLDADPTETSFTDYAGGSLDLSDCIHLEYFRLNVFRLTSLDLSGCIGLAYAECENSRTLSSLDVSACWGLRELKVRNCALTSLDLGGLNILDTVFCEGNPLTEIELTGTCMDFEHIGTNGPGTVYLDGTAAVAVPDEGEEFAGWFTDGGELISESLEIDGDDTDETRITAYFGEYEPTVMGDADGSGTVDVSDALIVLRAAMGLVPTTPEIVSGCDVDHDGGITVTDALMILRFAMGLVPVL